MAIPNLSGMTSSLVTGGAVRPLSVPIWEENPDLWDDIYINGRHNFGLVSVKVKKATQSDPKATTGTVGTTNSHLGYELAQVIIELRIHTQEQLDNYVELLRLLTPSDAKAKPLPIATQHPALQVLGISELYYASWTPPTPSATRGVWEATVTAEEFDPRKIGPGVLNPSGARPRDSDTPGSFGATAEKPPPSKNAKP